MTEKHRAEAQEIVDDLDDQFLKDLDPALQDDLANGIGERIAAALAARDAEIREVLEGLITCVLDEGNGPIPHWCPIGEDSDYECHPACLAARVLWEKVQPAKESTTEPRGSLGFSIEKMAGQKDR